MTQRRIELCRYLFAEFSVGGGKIKDATAVPSDVASGKTFYNNDGKQVGNGNIISYKEFVVPTTTNRQYYDRHQLSVYLRPNADALSIQGYNTTTSYSHYGAFSLPENVTKIKGIEIEGIKYLCDFSLNSGMGWGIAFNPSGSGNDEYCTLMNGMIYSGKKNNGTGNVKILY